jgi:hypothetical protein
MVTPQTRNQEFVPSQPINEEELLGGIDETE